MTLRSQRGRAPVGPIPLTAPFRRATASHAALPLGTVREGADVIDSPGIRELHIGHTIVARSVFVGLREAVRQMKALLREAAARAVHA